VSGPAQEVVPVLSVLFGTFNRLSLLQRCVASVRRAVGQLPYELVICDAGSNDGTRQWLSEQDDVVLIGRQELTGAVVAFNHCQQLARGKYLCTLNDDVEVEGDALARAVDMLEHEPAVGQIAMALRRHGAGAWMVNCISPPQYYYANFGVIRADLVERIVAITGGMWSPCYYTYGADVELSCWVYRLGYQVKPCPDLHVSDYEHRDGLREANHAGGKADCDGKLYNRRWGDKRALSPNGPLPAVSEREQQQLQAHEAGAMAYPPPASEVATATAPEARTAPAAGTAVEAIGAKASLLDVRPPDGHAPWRLSVLPDKERVVHVHLSGPHEPQNTMVQALRKLSRGGGAHDLIHWPALLESGGQPAVTAALHDACRRIKPTLVFMQLHRGDVLSPEAIAAARELCDEQCVFVSWVGDVVDQFGDTDHWAYALSRVCDIMSYSCMSHTDLHRQQGMDNTAYLQIGYDADRYKLGPEARYGSSWDVVYLAQRYRPEHLGSIVGGHDADVRTGCAEGLMQRFGKRCGVFGGGWPRGHVTAADSGNVYRASKLGVSISLCSQLKRYSSDRLLRALACGTGVLCKDFVDSASWGLRHGENVLMFETVQECIDLATEWVAADRSAELRQMGTSGAKLAREHHSWTVRMAELGVYLRAVRGQSIEVTRPW